MLWGKVIDAKYEEEGRWITKEVTAPYVVNLWRSDLNNSTKIKVNNGGKTSFWNDEWHEAGILVRLIPDIHNSVQHQQRSIAEMDS